MRLSYEYSKTMKKDILKYPLNYYENSTNYIRTNIFDDKLQIISGTSDYIMYVSRFFVNYEKERVHSGRPDPQLSERLQRESPVLLFAGPAGISDDFLHRSASV